MEPQPSNFQQAEDRVRAVLPVFDVQASSDFRTRVLARAAALQAPPHQRSRWTRRPWVAAWTPALAVGLVLGILFTVGIDRRLRPIEALLPQEEELRTTRGPAESQGSQQTLARLIQQGLHYERAGQTPQAMAAYQAALDQVTIPLNRLARLFEKQGEAAQGIPLARLAVQLRPDVAEYLDTLAALLCLVGEREEARSWLEKAAVLQPQKFLPKLEAFRGGACQ